MVRYFGCFGESEQRETEKSAIEINTIEIATKWTIKTCDSLDRSKVTREENRAKIWR